jgi:hypothetical protein
MGLITFNHYFQHLLKCYFLPPHSPNHGHFGRALCGHRIKNIHSDLISTSERGLYWFSPYIDRKHVRLPELVCKNCVFWALNFCSIGDFVYTDVTEIIPMFGGVDGPRCCLFSA